MFSFFYPFGNVLSHGKINNLYFDKFINFILIFKTTNLEIITTAKKITNLVIKYIPNADKKKSLKQL